MSACATCGHDPAKYRHRFTEADYSRMEALYRSGQTIKTVAEWFDCSRTMVRDVLVDREVPIRQRSEKGRS